MTRPDSTSLLASEFGNFLYAPIREDGNGMLLSVLSALARLDVDPWEEAANLARLPREIATERLASLISALPDKPSASLDPRTIAARLIALLPGRSNSNIPSRETSSDQMTLRTSVTTLIVFNVLFFAFMLGAQFVTASRQPPAQVDNVHAQGSNTLTPPKLPPRTIRDEPVGLGKRND